MRSLKRSPARGRDKVLNNNWNKLAGRKNWPAGERKRKTMSASRPKPAELREGSGDKRSASVQEDARG